jgi:hypothetical protein
MKKTIACFTSTLIVTVLLTGCSNPQADAGNQDNSSDAAGNAVGWSCETEQDGLGDSIYCSSSARDDDGAEWVLSLACTSDLQTYNSILGINADFSNILWTVGAESNIAKVRIDSAPIEEWLFGTKSGGQGIAFAQLTTIEGDENASTWEFISRLGNAETFGFQASDSEGYAQSVRFNVQNTASVAEDFLDLGCKG